MSLDGGECACIHFESVFDSERVSAQEIACSFQSNAKAVCEPLRRVDVALAGNLCPDAPYLCRGQLRLSDWILFDARDSGLERA